MRTYALRCPACEHRFEQAATAKDRDTIACPACDCTPVATDYQAQTLCVRVKVGGPSRSEIAASDRYTRESLAMHNPRTSLTHYFGKNAKQAREAIGGPAASCINDDGTVTYRSLADERRFKSAEAAMRSRIATKDAEMAGKIRKRAESRGVNPFGGTPGEVHRRTTMAELPAAVKAKMAKNSKIIGVK